MKILSVFKSPYLYLFLCAFLVIVPTLQWSYTLDDIDNFYLISQLKGAGDFCGYLLYPGDGHFIPLFRLLYFVCFKLFWLNPFVFHLAAVFAFFASAMILIKLIEKLTQSKAAGLCAGAFVLLSTGYTSCMEIVFTHSVFSLPLILYALYSLLKYQETKRLPWLFSVMACIVFAPFFSAMGILTGGWVILFSFLCCDDRNRKTTLIGPIAVWILSAALFLIKTKAVAAVGNPIEYLLNAFVLTAKAFWIYTLPRLTSYKDVSLFLAVFLALMAIVQRKKINFKVFAFFALWIIGNFLFAYFGRGKWGERLLNSPRYALYASFGMAAVVSLVIASIAQSKEWVSFLKPKKKVFAAALILLIGIHSIYQHQVIAKQTEKKKSLFVLGIQTESALDSYFQSNGNRPIFLKDNKTGLRMLYPIAQPMSYYASFLLRDESKKKVIWTSDKTEQNFLQHAKMKKNQYPQFFELLQDAQYFQQ